MIPSNISNAEIKPTDAELSKYQTFTKAEHGITAFRARFELWKKQQQSIPSELKDQGRK